MNDPSCVATFTQEVCVHFGVTLTTAALAMNDTLTAKDIGQAVLEQTGLSLMSGDTDALMPFFNLPQEIETFEGRRLISTDDEMRTMFEAVREYFRTSDVTDFVRVCLYADFKAPDHIEMMHETRLVARDKLVQAPYPVFTILHLVEGMWKIVHSVFAIPDSPRHSAALLGATSLQKPH